MQLIRARFGLVIGGLGLLLAACDGNDSNVTGISSLGSDFVDAFEADPNATPVDAQDVSLNLTPTVEPFDPS